MGPFPLPLKTHKHIKLMKWKAETAVSSFFSNSNPCSISVIDLSFHDLKLIIQLPVSRSCKFLGNIFIFAKVYPVQVNTRWLRSTAPKERSEYLE